MRKEEKKKKFNKQIFFALRIVVPIILGFLPSFLFIALFIQYGSPFVNYINFLSNLNSSLIAWISAIVIALFTHFIWGAVNSKKNFKKTVKNKFVLIIVILSFLVIVALIIAQLSLYVNFILGNDILVKLSSDKENIFFTPGSTQNVTFQISATMNPFCSAECTYEFFDEGTGSEIDTGAFNLTSVLSLKSETYQLQNNNLVQGSQNINRFEVGCKSKKTLLCYTSEDESTRSVLITLNYELTDDENQFKNESRDEIISLEKTLYSAENLLNASLNNINSINNFFYSGDLSAEYLRFYNSSLELNDSIFSMKDLWEKQNFDFLKEQIPDVTAQTNDFYNQSQQFNSSVLSNISLYNGIISNLSSSEQNLQQISQKNLAAALCIKLNNLISDFNSAVSNFNNELNLSGKEIIAENISDEINQFSENLQSTGATSCTLTVNLTQTNFTNIGTSAAEESNYTPILDDPDSVCCFLGECGKCCDKTCSNEDFPILFLHGHPINKALPADYSLDDLSEIKQKLVYENYLDAGAMVISESTEDADLWGKVNTSMMVTASYLFDTYRESDGKEITVPSDTNSIDTYAIRLNTLINLAKYRTGKNKVIIIAHSMGGLVARRYIQIFGGSDIDKLILIDVPNHGINDKIESYCGLFGQGLECSEMSNSSLFINNLNNAPTDIVPTYNIIGIGCNMGSETGDGIVENSSQYLSYANNYYINGTCDELHFIFLHQYIVYPEDYPETYTIIDEILKNSTLLK